MRSYSNEELLEEIRKGENEDNFMLFSNFESIATPEQLSEREIVLEAIKYGVRRFFAPY